jgi:tyrosine-protein kinase Etk/Wzc
MLPLLPVRKKSGATTIESAQVVEALRGIRMGLLHAHSGPGAVCLTVSSPGSGDGKSFLVSNLALAFTDLGHRTLVIDGDTRRGDLHHLLGASRKPGLIDFLAGQAAQEEIIQSTRFGSLDFIGSGTRRRESPELIASPRMFDLIARLRAQYDVVLVDSPPLSAGIDPLVLGTATGNMLLIMRAGRTDRALAGAKLAALDGLPIRLLGTVLNAMEPGGVYRYYSYAPDVGAEGEEVGELEGRPPVVGRAG